MVEQQEAGQQSQPSIELRVLLKRPQDFIQSTLWRRQRYAELATMGKKPNDPQEQERLSHEIQVLTARQHVLQRDLEAPSIAEIDGRLTRLTLAEELLQKRNDHDSYFEKQGMQIRREILEQRREELIYQLPIEERVLVYPLERIIQSLESRRNRLSQLQKQSGGGNTDESQRLLHELEVLESRHLILQGDSNVLDLKSLWNRLATVDIEMKKLIKDNSGNNSNELIGNNIRRKLLTKRYNELKLNEVIPIEFAVLSLRPDDIQSLLDFRKNRLQALQSGLQPLDEYEMRNLQEDIDILTSRHKQLDQDAHEDDIEELNDTLKIVNHHIDNLTDKKDMPSKYKLQGYLIEKLILETRQQELLQQENIQESLEHNGRGEIYQLLKELAPSPDHLPEVLHVTSELLGDIAEAMALTRDDGHEYSQLTYYNRFIRKNEHGIMIRGNTTDTSYKQVYYDKLQTVNPVTKKISFFHTHPNGSFFSSGDILSVRTSMDAPHINFVGSVAHDSISGQGEIIYAFISTKMSKKLPSVKQMILILNYLSLPSNSKIHLSDIETLGYGVYKWEKKRNQIIIPDDLQNGVTFKRLHVP